MMYLDESQRASHVVHLERCAGHLCAARHDEDLAPVVESVVIRM